MTEKKICAIVCNGQIRDCLWLKKSLAVYDFIIAANGGFLHLKEAGIRPDILIGDLDSSGTEQDDIKVISFPPEKDFTDTELAIHYAIDKGMNSIDLYGALGKRADHAFCNMLLLASYPGQLRMIDPRTSMTCCTGGQSIYINGNKGDILSLLPLTETAECTAKNLRYELKRENLKRSGRGMSNVFNEERIFLEVHSGDLIIIHTDKKELC